MAIFAEKSRGKGIIVAIIVVIVVIAADSFLPPRTTTINALETESSDR